MAEEETLFCSTKGCGLEAERNGDGRPLCGFCASVDRVQVNVRSSMRNEKKKAKKENDGLEDDMLPRVLWYKGEKEFLKKAKKEILKRGCVLVRGL